MLNIFNNDSLMRYQLLSDALCCNICVISWVAIANVFTLEISDTLNIILELNE